MEKFYVSKVQLPNGRKMTIAAGPAKNPVIDLTVDFVLQSFKDVNVANMKQSFYDDEVFENSGYVFNIQEQISESILTVL